MAPSHQNTSEFAAARTARQRRLPQWGESAQQRLAQSTVAIIGAGGLGSPAIQYLAAAGVNTLHIFDDDVVELSNLNRQVIHSVDTIGVPKVDNAVRIVQAIAPEITAMGHQLRLTPDNIDDLLSEITPDVIIDGSDSFETRFMVDHAAAMHRIPVVFGALMQFSAQVTVFHTPTSAGTPVRLTDVFPDTTEIRNTPGCAETGILGAVAGTVGSIMATETLKLLSGVGETLAGNLLLIDTLDFSTQKIALQPSETTGQVPTPTAQPNTMHLERAWKLADLENKFTDVVLIDVRREEEISSHPIPTGNMSVVSLPLDQLLQPHASQTLHQQLEQLAETISGSGAVVTVCAAGPRSIQALRLLRELGLEPTGYLDGGLNGAEFDSLTPAPTCSFEV